MKKILMTYQQTENSTKIQLLENEIQNIQNINKDLEDECKS